AKALDQARQGLAAAQSARKDLGSEREDLLKQATREGKKLDTTFGDNWLRFLDDGNTKLTVYIRELERIQKEENDPKKLEYLALVRQAELEMGRTEFGKALELYEKAIATGYA